MERKREYLERDRGMSPSLASILCVALATGIFTLFGAYIRQPKELASYPVSTAATTTHTLEYPRSSIVPFSSNMGFEVGPAAEDNKPESVKEKSLEVVFLLGVEGTGHHGVKILLRRLITESGHAMLIGGEDASLRTALENRNGTQVVELLQKFTGDTGDDQSPVLLMKGSFPGRDHLRGECIEKETDCMLEIKKYPMYDIGWIVEILSPISRKIKAICLDRKFLNLVASHRDWDGGIEQHAVVMAIYKQYLSGVLINVFPMEDWVLVNYEDLTGEVLRMESVAKALGEFMGWSAGWSRVARLTRFKPSKRNAANELAESEVQHIVDTSKRFTVQKLWKAYTDYPERRLLTGARDLSEG